MAATQEMVRIALTVKPDQVTLVPERREELTTEGGLDVVLNSVQLKPVVKTLKEGGIEVSLFVDPDLEQVKESPQARRARRSRSTPPPTPTRATSGRARPPCARWWTRPAWARKLGLAVHAGHGLTYANVGADRRASPRSPSSTSATTSWPGPCWWAWSAPCARWWRRMAAGVTARNSH